MTLAIDYSGKFYSNASMDNSEAWEWVGLSKKKKRMSGTKSKNTESKKKNIEWAGMSWKLPILIIAYL